MNSDHSNASTNGNVNGKGNRRGMEVDVGHGVEIAIVGAGAGRGVGEHKEPLPEPLKDTKTSPGEHMLTVDEACKRFETDLRSGLGAGAVRARLSRDGPNVLSPPKQLSLPMKFAKELVSGFSGILWVASVLAFIAWKPLGEPNPDPGNLTLGIVLIFVIFFQAAFNFYQEYQSSKVLESFRTMLSTKATVIRNGEQSEIDASGLVVGDVVRVAMGQNAPADMLLFRINNLKIDKAAITGESDPIEATLEPQPEQSFVEASNLVLLGTRVVEGDGAGIVIRVGDQCAVAAVVRMASLDTEETTLHKEVGHFVKIIVAAALLVAVAGAITWGAWLNVDYGSDSPGAQNGGVPFLTAAQLITNLIGMIVAFVPEGLPISVTMTLSLIAYRLVNRYHVVVTKLGTVETLGAVSMIASDKTGTITANKMTVRRLVTAQRSYDYSVATEDVESTKSPIVLNHLIRDAVLCNATEIQESSVPASLSVGASSGAGPASAAALNSQTVYLPGWKPNPGLMRAESHAKIEHETVGTRFTGANPDPSMSGPKFVGGGALDRAIMNFANGRVSVRKTRAAHSRVIEMPFNSATKVMISVHRLPKGSPNAAVPSTPSTPSLAPIAESKTSPATEDAAYLHPTLAVPTITISPSAGGPAAPFAAANTTSAAGAAASVAATAPVSASPIAASIAPKTGHYICVLKGAPEYVIARCASVLTEEANAVGKVIEKEIELTAAHADEILRRAERFGGNGERLVAVAELILPAAEFPDNFVFKSNPPNFPSARMCLVGLVSVMDPPRDDVAKAVADCQNGSIQVCMITGDHPSTAQAIARMVGIIRSPLEKVLTWAEAKRIPMNFGVDESGVPVVPQCACCGAPCPFCPDCCTGCWSRCTEPISKGYDAVTCDDCTNCPHLCSDNSNHSAHAADHAVLSDALSINRPAPVHRKANRLQNLALVVTGAELREFTADDWARVFRFEQLVFARTTPDQKLKIVTEAQLAGHVVAVTGDGVNDAPALKKANVGVAMGAATEVAQASADIVLRNNDFASIVRAVEQGRAVFDNLKKVIMYLLPAGSFSELLPVVVTVWLGAPTALSGFLMVIICLFTDVFASLALVHEPAESDLMLREPRDPARERLVDWKLLLYAYGYIGILESLFAFTAFGVYLRNNAPSAIAEANGTPEVPFHPSDWLLAFNAGVSIPTEIVFRGQSVFFVMLVMCQIGNLLTTRTRVAPIIPMEWFGLKSNIRARNNAAAVQPAPVTASVDVVVEGGGAANNNGVGFAAAKKSKEKENEREHRFIPIIVACVASIATAILITEGEWVNVRHVDAEYWLAGAAGGAAIFLMGEARKFWFNLWPNGLVAKLAW